MFASTKSFSACAMVFGILAAATVAVAQPLDKATRFTFSQPVALPGVTLPAGEYVFRVADPAVSSRLVQVLSADGRTPYAMFFSTEGEQAEPGSTPRVQFMETGAGVPAAIDSWWHPGERRGFKLVYPKEQARRLARGVAEGDIAARSVAKPPTAMPATIEVRQ